MAFEAGPELSFLCQLQAKLEGGQGSPRTRGMMWAASERSDAGLPVGGSAEVGEHTANFAWGHSGQLIVLVAEMDLVVVTTGDPFWLQHDGQSWKYAKRQLWLVSEFIASLP